MSLQYLGESASYFVCALTERPDLVIRVAKPGVKGDHLLCLENGIFGLLSVAAMNQPDFVVSRPVRLDAATQALVRGYAGTFKAAAFERIPNLILDPAALPYADQRSRILEARLLALAGQAKTLPPGATIRGVLFIAGKERMNYFYQDGKYHLFNVCFIPGDEKEQLKAMAGAGAAPYLIP